MLTKRLWMVQWIATSVLAFLWVIDKYVMLIRSRNLGCEYLPISSNCFIHSRFWFATRAVLKAAWRWPAHWMDEVAFSLKVSRRLSGNNGTQILAFLLVTSRWTFLTLATLRNSTSCSNSAVLSIFSWTFLVADIAAWASICASSSHSMHKLSRSINDWGSLCTNGILTLNLVLFEDILSVREWVGGVSEIGETLGNPIRMPRSGIEFLWKIRREQTD